MKLFIFKISFLITLSLLSVCNRPPNSADLIIIAPSYTININQPWVEAIAIKNERIIFVGKSNEALKFSNASTEIINQPNGMVLPGLIDTHVHLLWGGVEMGECQLNGITTSDKILDELKNYHYKYPEKKWIRGNGWGLPIFSGGNPKKELLDRIIPNKPVFLLSADGHSAWVNSKALQIAGINKHTIDPPNGRIERDSANKEPSGVLREDAMGLVESLIPSYSQNEINKGLELSLIEAKKVGITSILDAGTESYRQNIFKKINYDGLDAYKEATKNKSITLRVHATQYVYPKTWKKDLEFIKSRQFKNEMGIMQTVKIFIDGVIEGGTAALLEPYVGTNNYGILNWNPDTLKEVVRLYEKEGFQLHFHAIGDKGIRVTLDALEYSKNKNKSNNRRHMMSHIQLIHPDDISRFKALNVIAVFQPLWAYPDQYIKELTLPVLGPNRSKWNYPIRNVELTGAVISAGSDWSVTSLNPFHAMEVAITRQEPGNPSGESLNKEQAISLESILRAYTLGGAYSLFKENELGSIEKGKLADLVILDRNLFTIPSYDIHNTKVLMTIFNGEIVYKNKL